ncbi:MAG: lecithin retinol acyltransferase family protein [Lachnospiraceae bacterium]|nr:lecithin retinol acyltransferase family protein [Lachnospiraceae bacterium]
MSDMSAILKTIENNPAFVSEIGDCPNIEFPTAGGKLFWIDKKCVNGWKLQYNPLTGLSRIIDKNYIRKAWGNPVIMAEKFKRLTRKEFLEHGDVIGIVRRKALGIYEHYAVYIGDGKVVHYSGVGSDFLGKITVRLDTMQNFMKDDKDYFVLYFDAACTSPHKIQVRTTFNLSDVAYKSCVNLSSKKKVKIYSPEETVKRALSRIGEDKYSLLLNNCEHFAIWCKTGDSKSFQVDNTVYALMLAEDSEVVK